jgi:nucleoside-diphosphate-sugar epimerase
MINNSNKILVIGASGFVGAGIFESLAKLNYEVYGLGRKNEPWRINSNIRNKYFTTQKLGIMEVLDKIKPNVIINFAANGAYSFQSKFDEIVSSNLIMLEQIAKWSIENKSFLIHAGSSSEYGLNSAGPSENSQAEPNSLYAITKLAGSQLLKFYSKIGLGCAVLRLYSVYGPREDASRLMPAVMRGIINKEWPSFTDPLVSRDFIYIEDVSDLLIKILQSINSNSLGTFEVFNVGSGKATTIKDLIEILQVEFGMPDEVNISFPKRDWDIENWFANIEKVRNAYNWDAKNDLKTGLIKMRDWYLTDSNVMYLSSEYTEKSNG